MRKDLPVEKIKDGIYRLNEFDGTNCYLVIGSEKAMLIDCGTGFCDLKGAVKEITDLPLIVAATHGHVDHIGGMGQFESIYIHKDDCKKINEIQQSLFMRKLFTLSNKAVIENGFSAKDVFKPEFNTKIIKMNGSEVFRLGGKTVRVRHTPGHSLGSVAFIVDEDKIIFSGDNVCDALWMMLPGSTSIEEWLPSAQWLYEMSADYDVYWGHRTPKLQKEYIRQVIIWGKEITALYGRNAKISKITQYPKRPDGIIFRTGNIFKK